MWAQAVLAAATAALLFGSTPATSIVSSSSVESVSQLHLGCGINVFSRYGYLSISMRVVPRNDTADPTWIFREPTVDVFKNVIAVPPPRPLANPPIFDGDFHMEFCDNLKQLSQAYFRDFTFERFDKPWRAFTGSWSKSAIARHFGINASYATGDYCYVLVRVARRRESAKLATVPDNVILEDAVQREVDAVVTGDSPSALQFIKSFGSHYIASYVTGNSLYQVFVYTPQFYAKIKQRLKSRNINEIPNLELSNYFSPWCAEHIGNIQAASGNLTVAAWAADRLRLNFYVFTYASLLKLHGEASLLKQLDNLLGNEAVLQLDLRVLQPAFKDPAKRHWFMEFIDNFVQLWEVNM